MTEDKIYSLAREATNVLADAVASCLPEGSHIIMHDVAAYTNALLQPKVRDALLALYYAQLRAAPSAEEDPPPYALDRAGYLARALPDGPVTVDALARAPCSIAR